MAKNLVGKGNLERPLLLYNRTIKKAHDLSAVLPDGKSIVSSSIEDIVSKSDIIFICLGDDTAVKNTINTALTVSVEGKIFVDCSTTHPNNIKEIARQIEDKGAEFVACPVFGAQPVAEAGQLICVLAGPAAEKINPFLTGVVGRLTIDLSGQAAEKAALLKLIGNTFVMSQVRTSSPLPILTQPPNVMKF